MTTKNQYRFSLTELLVIIQVIMIVLWFRYLSNCTPIDDFTIILFKTFGYLSSLGLITYAFTSLKTLATNSQKGLRLLWPIAAGIIFYSLNQLAIVYTNQYRFVVTNKTGTTIDKLIITHVQQQETIDNFATNTQTELKFNYQENNSFYLITQYANKADTTYLLTGSTNNIGYIYNVDILIQNNKIIVNIDKGDKGYQ